MSSIMNSDAGLRCHFADNKTNPESCKITNYPSIQRHIQTSKLQDQVKILKEAQGEGMRRKNSYL